MRKLTKRRLLGFIDGMVDIKVLVAGDFMLDKYVMGKVERVSPEAPVPVLVVEREEFRPGGAGNVSANIRALGGFPYALGLVGDDLAANDLMDSLRVRNVGVDGLVRSPSRQTTIKCRVVAHGQQLVRMDSESTDEASPYELEQLLTTAHRLVPGVEALVLQDYNKGVLTDKMIRSLVTLGRKMTIPIAADPKLENFFAYEGATLFKPNQAEVERALGIAIRNHRQLLEAGRILRRRLKAQLLLITSGEHGMTLFNQRSQPQHIPSRAQEVYDVSGAGDTVISVMALALAVKARPLEAAYLATAAAGICVSKVGTQPVTNDELMGEIAHDDALG